MLAPAGAADPDGGADGASPPAGAACDHAQPPAPCAITPNRRDSTPHSPGPLPRRCPASGCALFALLTLSPPPPPTFPLWVCVHTRLPRLMADTSSRGGKTATASSSSFWEPHVKRRRRSQQTMERSGAVKETLTVEELCEADKAVYWQLMRGGGGRGAPVQARVFLKVRTIEWVDAHPEEGLVKPKLSDAERLSRRRLVEKGLLQGSTPGNRNCGPVSDMAQAARLGAAITHQMTAGPASGAGQPHFKPTETQPPYEKNVAGYPGSGWISWRWIGWTLIGSHCSSAFRMPGYPARVARITSTICLDNQPLVPG